MNGTIFFIQVYEDDPNYKKYSTSIEEQFDWVRIRHDKDIVQETGELKKPHIHYLITSNRMSISRLATLTGIPPNYIKVRANYAFAFRYLMHLDQPDKAEYSETELQGCQLQKRKFLYIDSEKEQVALHELINIVMRARNEGWKMEQMLQEIINQNLWGYYRASQSTFIQLYKQ